jgi:2-polyprenyl-6-methoxyphenol hydroxylase-like FAD-dependent oxidoreductase
METVTPIIIVGAGPVGLTLACLLAQRGVRVVVVESRTERSPHSRAIGIHPPALAVLDALGVEVGGQVRAEGIAITGGQVFCDAKRIGRLALPVPPICLPQARTEAILEARLATLAPGALQRGRQVVGIMETAKHVQVSCQDGESFAAPLVVGCDGTRSVVRTLAGIGQIGQTYPDRYLMGDFADDTDFGTDAALFFSREGIVESFPYRVKNAAGWLALVQTIQQRMFLVLLALFSPEQGTHPPQQPARG